jgi:hypothetical protein
VVKRVLDVAELVWQRIGSVRLEQRPQLANQLGVIEVQQFDKPMKRATIPHNSARPLG